MKSLLQPVFSGETDAWVPACDSAFQGHIRTVLPEVQGAGFGPRHFVSRATGHPLVRGFEKNDFRFWYSPKSGCVAPLMTNLFLAIGWIPILTTGQAGWGVNGMHAAYACGERPFGKGKIILCQLASGDGFVLANPTAREFSIRLLTGMSAEGGKPTKLTAANPGK